MVSNRSFDRAQSLASEFGGRAVKFDECLQAMRDADIVVSSTGSPHTILHREELEGVMRLRRNRPLFLIDIAVPRDIATDVQELENVYLYNVDHLETLVRENMKLREKELARCHEIIAHHAKELLERFTAPRERSPAATGAEWMIGPSCAIRT
jgi:glutamyl-tRNA reductase